MMRNTSILIVIVILFVAGIGMGYVVGFSGQKTTASVSVTTVTSNVTTTAQNNSQPFDLTLMITTNNNYNSTIGAQPAYYVVGANGLGPSGNISLPAHRLIKLVIFCYDDGSAPLLNSQYANVSGTQNGIETVDNNDNVNSSQGTTGINIVGPQNVTNVNASNIAHTFTIPALGVNLPIPPSSTVTAYLMLNETGTFTWACFTGCGYGANGEMGAMSTDAWMTGSLTVN
jgi:heme/copper-type cytochrome/quinol oxidase subunit 2